MTKRIGVLIIHGMGSHKVGYSARMVKKIEQRLGTQKSNVVWEEVHWADVLKEREDNVWGTLPGTLKSSWWPIRRQWIKLRSFVLHNFGDAVAYQRVDDDESAYTCIHDIISQSLVKLKANLNDPEAPIVVLGRSLGAHIISNYIWDRQNDSGDDPLESIENLAGVITMGCQIALFSLSFTLALPIILPGSGVTNNELSEAAAWLNFYDRDDVLGWPVYPIYIENYDDLNDEEKHTVDIIEEHEVNVGTLFTSWNPMTHLGYGTDKNVTKPVAEFLKELISTL